MLQMYIKMKSVMSDGQNDLTIINFAAGWTCHGMSLLLSLYFYLYTFVFYLLI